MASPSPGHSNYTIAPRWRTLFGLGALVLAFLLVAWPFVKRMGIEVDEAMVTAGIYERTAPWYSWHLFGQEIPIMLLTYLGAVKTWLLNPIFAIWGPGPISLRLPTVLMGAVTVVLFFALLDRILGRRAAWVGAALLAADPSFVLTEAVDFGPVALQHLFKLGALLLLVMFHQRPSTARLAGGFFLFGLAMWDKANFVWILVGLVCAAPLIWREIRPHIGVRNLLTASGAFLVGALPLVIYNIERPLETFTSTVHLAPDNPFIKLVVTLRTFNGSGAFGYFTAPDLGPHPGTAHGFAQHAAFAICTVFREPWTSLMPWACLAALAALPLVWQTRARRPALFSLTVMAVTWLLMFFTNGAGGAIHHVILLWPFHLIVIAAVFCEVAARMGRYAMPALVAVTVLLCASDLLVLNSYYVSLLRNGTAVRWTDAFKPLSLWLDKTKAPRIVTVDWGILETLVLLSEGELPVEDVSVPLKSAGDTRNGSQIRSLISSEGAIFVAHGLPYEQWAGSYERLVRYAATLGYSPELLQSIQDRNGRPIFEIFRFRRAG